MQSEAFAIEAPVPAKAPAPDSSDRAPDHTVLSVVLMLALSAAVLGGVEWRLRDRRPALAGWGVGAASFSDPRWSLPAGVTHEGDGGISWELNTEGGVPVLSYEIDADTVRQVRAEAQVVRVSDGEAVPFVLNWNWAHPEEAADGGSWPSAQERMVTLYRPVRHHPALHQANLGWHPEWNGVIAKMSVSVQLWTNAPGPYRITVRRIELMG